MKRATLIRSPWVDEGTFGLLTFDGSNLQTTELPWRDNAPRVSCIPTGTYVVDLTTSPKFGRVYEVKNVPGRDHILIHPANFGGDVAKGWHSELLGCIAPAMVTGPLRNPEGKMQMAGLSSRAALGEFMAWAAGAPFELEIR